MSTTPLTIDTVGTTSNVLSSTTTSPSTMLVNSTLFSSSSTVGTILNDPIANLDIPYTIMELLVAVVAVLGNALVIIVFYRERRLRRRTNYYIISLAIADLLVGLLGVPFAIMASVGLPKGLHACLFTVSLLVVLCTISIFCLVAVSIDRYWAILHPMAYSRNVRTKTAIGICLLCWLFGSLIGFLPLFGWHSGAPGEGCLFTKIMDYNYLVFLYFTTIITPAILLAVFYGLIYRVIIKQMRHIVTMNSSSNKTSSVKIYALDSTKSRGSMAGSFANISGNLSSAQGSNNGSQGGTMLRMLSSAAQKREVKATQNLSIIVLFFMICWIPLYTINCIKAFCPDCEIHDSLTVFGIILSHSNSAVNPLLYAYHLKDFRGALMRLFRCKKKQEQFYRPSIISQQQQQHLRQTLSRSLQPKIYIDSPIWKRAQLEQQKLDIEEAMEKEGKNRKYNSPHHKNPEPELSRITEASVSEYSINERNSINDNSNNSTLNNQQASKVVSDTEELDFLIMADDKNKILSIYDTSLLCDKCKLMKSVSIDETIVETPKSETTETTTVDIEPTTTSSSTTATINNNSSSQDLEINTNKFKTFCYISNKGNLNINNIYLINNGSSEICSKTIANLNGGTTKSNCKNCVKMKLQQRNVKEDDGLANSTSTNSTPLSPKFNMFYQDSEDDLEESNI